jgi:hypothetical protein
MGSGYRTFTAGEVLTASNVQNYLQDQAVMVFAGTAARSSAIGTANFEEGMLTYLTDVDKLQVYTGATFADVYPAAASTQGLTLINTTSFSGVATQSIPNCFSATYDDYTIKVSLTAVTLDAVLWLKLRTGSTDLSANYQAALRGVNNAGTSRDTCSSGTTHFIINELDGGNSNHMYYSNLDLSYPFLSQRKVLTLTAGGVDSAGAFMSLSGACCNTNTSSYESLTIGATAGNITGSISIFGVAK